MNSSVSAIVFMTTIAMVSWAYAALTSWLSVSDLSSSWTTISSASWNRIVNAVLELDQRTSWTEVFVAEAFQNSIASTSASTWMDVPWASATFTLPSAKTLNLRSFGSVSASAGTAPYAHCWFRFVVDWIPYGNVTWGDQIVWCNSSASWTPSWWWCPWGIERNLAVNSGSHTVKVQMIWWGAWYATCTLDNTDYSKARLFIRSR